MSNDKDKPEHPPHPVEVTVDGKKHEGIKPGSYIVSDFKKVVHVDAGKVLEQLINGVFTPLEDGATVEIHGGEVFTSHVPRGGSSWK